MGKKKILVAVLLSFVLFTFGCGGGGGGDDDDDNGSNDRNPTVQTDPRNVDDDGDGFTENGGDCNDNNRNVHPNAQEVCGDGIDQDCSGADLTCPPDPEDVDDDGDGVTENQGDCDDANAAVNPNAQEICGDGIDQDCSGADLACAADPRDVDDDGDGVTENQGDCDDANAAVNPNAQEICGDGIDQDCSGADLACAPDPSDVDDDGDGVTENQGDCDDANGAIHPNAQEVCGDGIDQDCSGADLACAPDPSDVDDDGDGFTENQGDCNDENAAVNPDAQEICGDGIDQDCNGIDLACDEPSLEAINEYARDTGTAIRTRDIDLLMDRISPVYLDDGQTAACYGEYMEWFFNGNYTDYQYIVNNAVLESDPNYARADVTLILEQSGAQGTPITRESTDQHYLGFEAGEWTRYGNQQDYPPPSGTMITCEYYDPLSGEIVGRKDVFTNQDDAALIVFDVKDIQQGDTIAINVFRPDGSLSEYSAPAFTLNLGLDFPSCGRLPIPLTLQHRVNIQNFEGVPGYEDEWKRNVGMWQARLMLNGSTQLSVIQFEYQYIP